MGDGRYHDAVWETLRQGMGPGGNQREGRGCLLVSLNELGLSQEDERQLNAHGKELGLRPWDVGLHLQKSHQLPLRKRANESQHLPDRRLSPLSGSWYEALSARTPWTQRWGRNTELTPRAACDTSTGIRDPIDPKDLAKGI